MADVGRIAAKIHHLGSAAAAVLAGGEDAVLSHASAAALWDMGKWPTPPEVIASGHRRRPGIHVHRCSKLNRRDITWQRGIRVTSPARTALDIAPRILVEQLIRAVNDAENAGWLRRGEMIDADAATLEAEHVTIRLTWERRHRNPAREAERLHRILQRLDP